MKRVFFILSIAALALPAAALGKGPSEASIEGPGTGSITFSRGTLDLAEQAGFFSAVFAQQPNPMLARRPKGDLGPKYTISYTVPGPSNETWKIRQDVYPYAQPAPVTYMEPGQSIYDTETRGGWFRGDARLRATLFEAGLPASAPAARSPALSFSTTLVGLLAVILLVAATAVGLRRIGRWPFRSRSTSIA